MTEENHKFYIGCCGVIPTDRFLRLAMLVQDEKQDIYKEDEIFVEE